MLLKNFNERLLLKENVQLLLNIYFFNVEDCVAASCYISMYFNERAAASEKILTTASEIYSKKKNVPLLLRNYVHLRNYFEAKNRSKIKTGWKHFGTPLLLHIFG